MTTQTEIAERIAVTETKVEDIKEDISEIKKLVTDMHTDVIAIKAKQESGLAAFIANNSKLLIGCVCVLASGGGITGVLKVLEMFS